LLVSFCRALQPSQYLWYARFVLYHTRDNTIYFEREQNTVTAWLLTCRL
jgi:hypothetical protein